jgi:pimeloyl-ACP methyl ester carboxylesterase
MGRGLAAATIILALSSALPAAATPPSVSAEDALVGGARWTADVPADWNGVLLLWSRGYSEAVPPPSDAPPELKAWLLQQGYALAGSNYGAGGWALEQAQPAQIATLDAFTKRFGRPRRVIAWGASMGGLTTIALVERRPDRIDAALPLCGSVGGVIGMMNTALDGAVAFETLLAPDQSIALVGVKDDRANGRLVADAVARAQATPEGRARLALAAALAQLPAWTDPKAPEPAADDYARQEEDAAKAFAMGVFLPRQDQERRAGGVFSWTDGVDFSVQLARSGRREAVLALYARAGLDLDADLARLNAAPRIHADPKAIAYMARNYAPSGDLVRPVLSLHTTGDGMTTPANEASYAETVHRRERDAKLRLAWVRRAGHCNFAPAELAGALSTLEARLDAGRWSTSPADLQARADASGLGAAAFTDNAPPPFARPYAARPKHRPTARRKSGPERPK